MCQAGGGYDQNSLRISPTPRELSVTVCVFSPTETGLTGAADESDQLRRAATIITDWDDIVKLALSVLNYPVEQIDEAIPTGACDTNGGAERQLSSNKQYTRAPAACMYIQALATYLPKIR